MHPDLGGLTHNLCTLAAGNFAQETEFRWFCHLLKDLGECLNLTYTSWLRFVAGIQQQRASAEIWKLILLVWTRAQSQNLTINK